MQYAVTADTQYQEDCGLEGSAPQGRQGLKEGLVCQPLEERVDQVYTEGGPGEEGNGTGQRMPGGDYMGQQEDACSHQKGRGGEAIEKDHVEGTLREAALPGKEEFTGKTGEKEKDRHQETFCGLAVEIPAPKAQTDAGKDRWQDVAQQGRTFLTEGEEVLQAGQKASAEQEGSQNVTQLLLGCPAGNDPGDGKGQVEAKGKVEVVKVVVGVAGEPVFGRLPQKRGERGAAPQHKDSETLV